MSDDNFEALRGDAYDLGTVTEDCELDGQEQHGVKLPQYDQVLMIYSGTSLSIRTSLN